MASKQGALGGPASGTGTEALTIFKLQPTIDLDGIDFIRTSGIQLCE